MADGAPSPPSTSWPLVVEGGIIDGERCANRGASGGGGEGK